MQINSDFRPPGIEQNRIWERLSWEWAEYNAGMVRSPAQKAAFSKHRRTGNPGIFCFPITGDLQQNSRSLSFQKGTKGRHELAARNNNGFTSAARTFRQQRFPTAAGSSSHCFRKSR